MPEIFSDGFQTSLAAAITSTARPVTFTVAAGSAQLSTGNFSVLIYDAGTDANPVNAERIQVTSVAGTSWTGTTEASDTAKTHVNGSTVRQILTARSIQQQMVDHTNTTTTPDPHNQYVRKSVLTTIGDLFVGTAVGLTRLAKGADGTALTADSTVTPSGLAWRASGASVLTSIGDLLTMAAAGAVRLPIGAVGQLLSIVQNASLIADPVAAPTISNTPVPPANTWATTTAYLIGYSYANAYGETLLSGTVTYNSGATPVSQDVTTPAVPAGVTTLYIYVGLTAPTMHRTNTIASPSTSSPNVVTVTGPNLPGAAPAASNLTGGRSPVWSRAVDVMTAVGDLVIGGVAGLPTRLAVGTTNQLLSVVAGTAAWVSDLVINALTIAGSSGATNGQSVAILSLTELTTIAAAVSSTTVIQIPANAVVLAVNVRVTVAIPTAATFTVIGNTSTTAFNTAAVNAAANSTDPGTAAGAFFNATAQTVRITPNLTPAANTGRVRLTIFYLLSTPPTS